MDKLCASMRAQVRSIRDSMCAESRLPVAEAAGIHATPVLKLPEMKINFVHILGPNSTLQSVGELH